MTHIHRLLLIFNGFISRFNRPSHRALAVLLTVGLTAGVMFWRLPRAFAGGTISGTVYVDYNMNGVRDTSGTAPNLAIDNGISGVTVTAYDSGGTQRGTATTAATGAYSLTATGTGPYRIEFTNLPGGYSPSASGANNATTVRFVADGSTANVDVGIIRPDDYAQANPLVANPVFVLGNNEGDSLVTFPYGYTRDLDGNIVSDWTTSPSRGASMAPASIGKNNSIGSTYGLAWDKRTRNLYASAYIKRAGKLGSLSSESTGAIYVKSNPSSVTPAPTLYVDLNSVFGAGTAGANPHPAATTDWAADTATTSQVGKIGLGDLEIAADGSKIYTVNLNDRRLYVIPTSGALNATTITRFDIPASGLSTGAGNCPTADVRPFGLGRDASGNIYVGAVCSGESVTNRNYLQAFVWSFDGAAFTLVATNNLTFTRKLTSSANVLWDYWATVDNVINRAAPMLTDIEFDRGDMLLGIRDRYGDQVFTPDFYRGYGDIMRACPSGPTWTFESNGACGGVTTGGAGNGSGNGGGEFYLDLTGDANRDEGLIGSLVQVSGYNHILSTAYDAVGYNSSGARTNNFYTGGVQRYHNTNGTQTGAYDVFLDADPNTFSKASGIGDLEVLNEVAPLQIGNRVWNDANGNGRQDPDEDGNGTLDANHNGIAGVSVQLWADTDANGAADTQVGSATTDTTGNYYFGGAGYTNMSSSCADTVLPAQTISASADDAVEDNVTHAVSNNATSLNLGSNTTNPTLAGLRFPAIAIPRGSKIVSASIVFTSNSNDSATPVGLNIQGEVNGASAAFGTANNDISNRSRTAAVVNWPNIGAWTSGATTNATTPDITRVVQELVSAGDWKSGNAMNFVISDDGTSGTRRRRPRSADNGSAGKPTLNITYSSCPYTVNPNTVYEVRIPNSNFAGALTNFALTRINADSTANGDSRDSDGAYFSGGNVKATITTGGYGQNDHTVDFGFKTNTVSLGNRVFLDNGGATPANANNGVFNAGETGLSGVTVELYDSTGATLLGTTTTDASGYYSFPGLASGTAYHVRLAASNFNTGGPLVNYGSSTGPGGTCEGTLTPDANQPASADSEDKGTTTPVLTTGGYIQTRVAVAVTAGSGPLSEENGGGDVNPDNNQNLKVDFGLINYSLGNRVWLDNGAGNSSNANNGVLDAGELGLPGVSVSLFADATCDGAIDTPGSPLATVVTDSVGYYRFDGLKTACYIVRVNPSNFSAGQPLANLLSSATTVNAGSNSTDSRDNGIDDATPATNGIRSNTINLATKSMPSGETNPGSYGSGSTGSQSGTATAAADTANDLTVDFGFRQNAPTAVELTSFEAYTDGATVRLEWRSGREDNNLGFNLYRSANGGKPLRINAELLAGSTFKVAPGTTLTAGDGYVWQDEYQPNAQYWLEALDLKGRRQWFGPFTAKSDAAAVARLAHATPARTLSQLHQTHAAAAANALLPKAMRSAAANHIAAGSDAAATQRRLAAGPAVKIGVRESGWYRVTGAQLQAAGLRADADPRALQLYADGVEIPMNVQAAADNGFGANDFIEFYGFGLDERESDTRAYWLVAGEEPGLRFGAAGRAAPAAGNNNGKVGTDAPRVANSFPFTVERADRTLYFSALTNGEDNPNFFGAVVTSTPVDQALRVTALDAAASSQARLEVVLQGATTDAHHVNIKVNGQAVGTMDWNGMTPHTARFDFVNSALQEGDNVVTLAAPNANDYSLVARLRLTYARRYRAANDQLVFTVGARQSAQVEGFNSPNVRLFDLTDPARAFQVAAKVDGQAAGYTLFVPADANRTMFAIAGDQALSPAFITANEPSSWTTDAHEADLVIVTPQAFSRAVAPLTTRREAEGLRTSVIALEDIFDETTGGTKRVQAVRDFLRFARDHWHAAPQYVLLAGDASYDPRNFLNLGGHDLVPTGWVNALYIETSSDESLVDFDGDGVGEMAVGRLPARTAGQVQRMVGKIASYQPRGLADGAFFVADQPEGYNFAAMNQAAAAQLPAGTSSAFLVRGAQPEAATRQQLLSTLNQGPALVNYAGHGSVQVWAGSGILQNDDAPPLANSNRLSFYVMLTCLNGYFADEYGDSLAEALLNAPNGAAAVWASSGLTLANGQQTAAHEFYRRAYGPVPARLGDAIRAGKAVTGDPLVRSTWTLFGDPTMKVAP